jgi:hypothetical protein
MTEKVNNSLSDTLGIEYVPETKEPEIIPPEKKAAKTEVVNIPIVPSTSSDAEDDYNLARTTFRHLIQQGNLAMEDMKELARQSESPRAYEVFSTMMKTIADTTNNLYDLQKKTKELKDEPKKSASDSINIDKAVFVGTTADLLKKIKAEKK